MSARRDPWLDADIDRFSIFVPAIMSAGLLFSVLTLVRDAAHDRQHRHRARRVRIAAAATADHVTTGDPAATTLAQLVRPRVTYLAISLSCVVVAAYIAIGAVANYLRPGGYVSDIAWLLSLSAITVLFLVWLGLGAGMLFARFPHTPAWVAELLLSTPLGQTPGLDAAWSRRRFALGWAALAAGGGFAVITLGVASSRATFQRADQRLLDEVVSWSWIESITWINVLGRTQVAVAAALLIGVATLRCLPFAMGYLTAVVSALGVDAVVKLVVDRDRPPDTSFTGLEDSYPSGHIVQAVLLAGLVPLALHVLTDRKAMPRVVGALLAVGVVLASLQRMHASLHWPTDVLGGLALGATAVLTVRWALERPSWHQRCHRCPWSSSPGPAHTLIEVGPRGRRLLHRASLVWTAAAISLFGVLALWVGIPRDPDGDSLGALVEVIGTQVALALVVLAWLVAIRWPGAGAMGLVVGGLVLGLLSSVAYHPAISLLVAAAFGLPAVGLWVSWQHGRRRGAVVVLAVATALSGTGLFVGAEAVNDHFYGPAHPASDTPALAIDHVDWLWSGAISTDGFEVVAHLEHARQAALVVEGPAGAPDTRSAVVDVPDHGTVRLPIDGLQPGTRYAYTVEVDGEADRGRGRGEASTAPAGPADVRIAVASCARTGSNGQVFDAIRAADPDLYVIAGDFHYGNPSTPDIGLFRSLISRVLRTPAQAALYRDVPVAYVWDDHDYGPNDADSTSPTRDVAREAYRELVPNTAAPAGPINQAFSYGRVRFVLTDTRSARTDDTMLGPEQLAWLLDELRTASRTHAVVVWVNAVPWITDVAPDRDDWGAYPHERQEILDALDDASIENLVMLSGDAHMVALDDGTNSGGFPVLHAAALDRPGNVKGGPYSEGAYPGAGQFGLVEVLDDGGDRVEVTLSGRTWDGRLLVTETFTIDVPKETRP